MARTVLLMLAALTALALAPTTGAVHGTVQTKSYTLGGQATFFNSCESASGIGGVRFCIENDPPPSRVTFTIRDHSGVVTGAIVRFTAGTLGSAQYSICGQATVDVPADSANEVLVTVSSQVVFAGCVSGPGTTGTITAAWSAT